MDVLPNHLPLHLRQARRTEGRKSYPIVHPPLVWYEPVRVREVEEAWTVPRTPDESRHASLASRQ